jgi:hypothetical protein
MKNPVLVAAGASLYLPHWNINLSAVKAQVEAMIKAHEGQ